MKKVSRTFPEVIDKSKSELRKCQSRLPIEQKIRLLIELQKMGKLANPGKTKNKTVWNCNLKEPD
jgi:hypothetical protein